METAIRRVGNFVLRPAFAPNGTPIVRMEAKLIHPGAKLPSRVRGTDAGYDIYSIESVTLPSVGWVPFWRKRRDRSTIVKTGICISAPPGYYYTIEGRSSLWSKGIVPNRGIIDSTYCGEVVVSLVNFSNRPYQINAGDRIAQILLHQQLDAHFEEVEDFSAEYNQRGKAGFGSTGK
jgi:dUTP pyrophosphatase